ncbi:hypothetical protein CKM354_000226300 [Cercospora kikuchii]|uniref:Fungal-specific transcription factor domain-containing protein n=1 Tax=Cercospora kikuchii TaxID=84275 RepID=A0A9P3FDJ5_9PEZI|nr:uncharacterized protein CKM354_000226300 [Cercospora kikuchii]GIZ38864.1 hypothetical protein CKM354_000226300 [Cercospora kikuchii]
MVPASLVKRVRIRKPRGRGLRTRTGVSADFCTSPSGVHLRIVANDSWDSVPSIVHDPEGGLDFASPASTGTGSTAPPIGVATARWFEMLAQDANLTDQSFPLSVTPNVEEDASGLHFPYVGESGSTSNSSLAALENCRSTFDLTKSLALDETPWRTSEPITVGQYEAHLFAEFTVNISQWIDLLDPYKHFASLVPRIALRNLGLLSAILALSARHMSVSLRRTIAEKAHARDQALKYYYESLHSLRTDMQHTSFQFSEELLATTLIISAFEMLDGSPQDWQRHLEGVFGIQRSQVIHGDSGGVKGAVWWAWLCQDIWAAFRGKRKVFTFWRPTITLPKLNSHQLAARSVVLLGQVLNYCAMEDHCTDLPLAISNMLEEARNLTYLLDEWESCITPEFAPLPCLERAENSVFKPIWIHPPMFACAMQAYHLSRLLIALHRPALGGFCERDERQAVLNKHVSKICGISLTLSDYGSSIMASMCLFIAGRCATGRDARDEIVTLLEECRKRTGWPVKPLSEELIVYWAELNAM